MSLPDYDSPCALKEILDSRGMAMQKKFGQNFLVNKNARTRIADFLNLDENTSVWEVGPGLGALTTEILKRKANVTAFEIDRGFVNFLEQEIAPEFPGKLKVICGDFLKNWKAELSELKKNGGKFPERFFGNLPYNVAATIVADMISNGIRFDQCIMTVQKEVAERICAKKSSENYSSFSVLCQWAYDVKPLMDLSGGSFWPRPNVDSRVVFFSKKENFPACKNPDVFLRMLRGLFACRRKTIKNNMLNVTNNLLLAEEALNRASIAFNVRSETLGVDELLVLSDKLDEVLKENKNG